MDPFGTLIEMSRSANELPALQLTSLSSIALFTDASAGLGVEGRREFVGPDAQSCCVREESLNELVSSGGTFLVFQVVGHLLNEAALPVSQFHEAV